MMATVQQRQRQWRQQQEAEGDTGDTALPSEEEYRARLQYYLVSLFHPLVFHPLVFHLKLIEH